MERANQYTSHRKPPNDYAWDRESQVYVATRKYIDLLAPDQQAWALAHAGMPIVLAAVKEAVTT